MLLQASHRRSWLLKGFSNGSRTMLNVCHMWKKESGVPSAGPMSTTISFTVGRQKKSPLSPRDLRYCKSFTGDLGGWNASSDPRQIAATDEKKKQRRICPKRVRTHDYNNRIGRKKTEGRLVNLYKNIYICYREKEREKGEERDLDTKNCEPLLLFRNLFRNRQ